MYNNNKFNFNIIISMNEWACASEHVYVCKEAILCKWLQLLSVTYGTITAMDQQVEEMRTRVGLHEYSVTNVSERPAGHAC